MIPTDKIKPNTIHNQDCCKKLRKEIKMLEHLADLANPMDWDVELTYQDILNGTESGNKVEGLQPDKEFAKWFAKRYGGDEQ